MSNITNEEIELLKQASLAGNEDDWNEACDKIKQNHFGQYPNDWYKVVTVGGVIPDATISQL